MDKDAQNPGGRPPRGEHPEPLTDAQKKAAKAVFAEYDLGKLTEDEAQAILKALEAAGIKGPGVRDAVQEGGMDPEKFGQLLGMDERPHGDRPPHGPGGPGGHRPPPPGGKPPSGHHV